MATKQKLPNYWYNMAKAVLDANKWENEVRPGDRVATISVYSAELHEILLAAKWAYRNGYKKDK